VPPPPPPALPPPAQPSCLGVLAPALQCALLELRAPWKLADLAGSSLATCCATPARLAPSTPWLTARAAPYAPPLKSPTKNAPSVVGAGRGLPALQPAWVPISRGACHTAGDSSGVADSAISVHGAEQRLMIAHRTAPTHIPAAAACAAECPAGTTCTAPQCPAGQELLAGATSCTDCPAGTVNPTPGGTCSTTCTAPKVANQARTECGGCWAWLACTAACVGAARQGCLSHSRRRQRWRR